MAAGRAIGRDLLAISLSCFCRAFWGNSPLSSASWVHRRYSTVQQIRSLINSVEKTETEAKYWVPVFTLENLRVMERAVPCKTSRSIETTAYRSVKRKREGPPAGGGRLVVSPAASFD